MELQKQPKALPMRRRRRLFNTVLRSFCAISVADAGMSESDVDRYVAEAPTPDDINRAVLEYADDYGLDVRGRGWL